MVTTEQNNTPLEEVMKLNLESQKAMTLAILTEIKNSEYDDAGVKKTLADYGVAINEVKEMAKILDDLEKGQIEEMLLKLLNNANLQDILAGIAVAVGGTNYSVKSVVEALANVPKVIKEEIVEDENGVTTARKMTLDDGTVITLDATRTVSEDGKSVTFVFKGDVKGFPVEMGMVLSKKTAVAGNVNIDTWLPKEISHITFDLTQLLKSAVTAGTNEEIADTDEDGTVG
jgi:L-fucose isomerase-like protein